MAIIVHVSDWHGGSCELPLADVYVVTGDMLPNFLLFDVSLPNGRSFTWDPRDRFERPLPRGAQIVGRHVIPGREECLQNEWIEKRGCMRDVFPEACRNNPVVCVRGNHDFTDLRPLFGGETYELGDPMRAEEICGMRFVGIRGIPYIRGEWADERRPEQLDADAGALPDDVDVLVSHCPPVGIMDDPSNGFHLGHRGVTRYVQKHMYGQGRLKLHAFGHIHEKHGLADHQGITFSNAATTFHRIELT